MKAVQGAVLASLFVLSTLCSAENDAETVPRVPRFGEGDDGGLCDAGSDAAVRRVLPSQGWPLCTGDNSCRVAEPPQSADCPAFDPSSGSDCPQMLRVTCDYCRTLSITYDAWRECRCREGYWSCQDWHCDPRFEYPDDAGIVIQE